MFPPVIFAYYLLLAPGVLSIRGEGRILMQWWRLEPLAFRDEKHANSTGPPLHGILPEILQSVSNSCESVLTAHAVDFDDILTKETGEAMTKLTFSDRIGCKDLALPVKLRNVAGKVQGMEFVSLLRSPGIAVIARTTLAGTELLKAILLAWPILIFVVLSALLSGFFVWFLEYRSNPQMFDPFCPKGVLNGFWFASVTMTTVGYGDVIPKTIIGRLFTIVWIIVGLVILAMYMGVVTTSLTNNRLDETHHFYGITVAAVNESEEEKFAILHKANLKVQENELQVINAVHGGRVKVGFIDFYLASYHLNILRQKKLDIVRVISRDCAYGVLFGKDWHPDIVDCFRRHADDYHMIHELIPKYIVESKHERGLMEYFSGSAFGLSIYILLGVLVLFTMLGFFYDRSRCRNYDKDQTW